MKKMALAGMLLAALGLCQAPAQEPDALRALLVEVHLLRQDIQAMTVASQRVQIALYSLQMQDTAVARATERLDTVRNKCRGEEVNRQHMASEVQRLEKGLGEAETAPSNVPGAPPADEVKALRARLSELKTGLEAQTAEEQACQAAEAEASSSLRNNQAKLAELQDRIERLDKALEQLGAAGK
jgi:chromosome segregation ATPase